MNELDIFSEALELDSPPQRERYLDSACEGNTPLRQRIENLLKSSRQSDEFMQGSPLEIDPTDLISPSERPGSVIGPYKLLEQIGEGGMGVVFMAQQTTPIQRKVALKIIKPGMDTREVIARFEVERQALALMDHPNVAKVLDAGESESGRPYFVMDLVHGIRITKFCDEQKLPTDERLRLFVDVCQAIQHAHHKGIIHRDLKPSNVMVTMHDDRAVPKVIDFGVSKALSQQLTEKTLFTAYGQMIGTPPYMSPEQAQMSGLDIDTRSDVYSLGVLLYEMLTGTTPFDGSAMKKAGHDEMRRIILEDEPPKPSERISTLAAEALSTVSKKRSIDPRKLTHTLRGDLDWIVMKCLEKDRTRRYETASALAADVQRHLDDEAVRARPPSATYRLRKWARRHKNAVALTSATLLLSGLLLAGLLLSRHQRLAELQTAAQEAVTAAELSLARGQYDLTVGRLMEARSRLADAPESLLPITQQIDDLLATAEGQRQVRQFRHLASQARAYAYFDHDLRKARVVCEKALRSYDIAEATSVAEALPSELRDDAFELLLILSRARFYVAPDKNKSTQTARLVEALATLERAELLRRGGPAIHLYRAEFLKRSGEEAAAKDEEALAAEAEPRTALDHFLLGRRAGRVDAIAHFMAALRVQEDHVPSLLLLGQVYGRGKQPEQAVICYTACLALLSDDDIFAVRLAYASRGEVYQDQLDNLPLALSDFTSARDIDPTRWSPHSFRGNANHELKNYQDAIADYTVALELIQGQNGFNKAYAAEVRFNRGHTYLELGDFEAATADLDRAVDWMPTRFGEDVARLYAQGPEELRDPAKAIAISRANVEAYRKRKDKSPNNVSIRNNLANHLHSLGKLLETNGRLAEAEQAFAEFLNIHEKLVEDVPGQTAFVNGMAEGYTRLITVLQKSEQGKKAGTLFVEAQKLKYDAPHWISRLSWWLATWPDEKHRDPQRAIELAKKAIEAQGKNAGHWSNLGAAQYRAGNWQEAVTALKKYNAHVHDAFFLAMSHWQLGDKDRARKYFNEAVGRMEKHEPDDEELARFRAEAAALLEIKEDK